MDRDGTIVTDVPYNGNPDLVRPVRGARNALARLRAAGLRLAVVSNQSGIGRGRISAADVECVNRRVEELLGHFDAWYYCPHAPQDGCDCRKPQPRLLREAAYHLGVQPRDVAVIGDKESDMQAARNAGMTGIKVSGARTLADAVDEIVRPLN